MKKAFAILLIALVALAAIACGKNDSIVGTCEDAAEYARKMQATNELQIVYTFTEDGKVTYTASAAGQSNTDTGAYRIEGNRLYMPEDSVMEFVLEGKYLTLTEHCETDDGGTVPAIVVLTRK